MKKSTLLVLLLSLSLFYSCDFFISTSSESTDAPNIKESQETQIDTLTTHLKPFKEDLPTIGLLMYNGVLTTEITATADVFTKPTQDGEQLFNVITIAETKTPIVTEEGLNLTPDYTFENCPQLEVLFIPSAYDMYSQVHNSKIVDFIKEKNKETTYTVSNCAGAQLVGASGIAKGKKIVTWIGGGKDLQETYPELKVQNDSLISYVEDGKFLSSNGNLTSYISALNLLTKMTSKEHTKFVESYLYLDQLQGWKQEY